MRFRFSSPSFWLLLLGLALAACGSEEEKSDPCLGVTCLEGQECVDGTCRDVVEPEGCATDADCAFDPAGRLCDRNTNACVACFLDTHCALGRRCSGGACEGDVCTTDADCGEGTYCNDAGSACVACREDEHCPEGEVCSAEGACVTPQIDCDADEDCTEPTRPACGSQGFCVECTEQDDCAAGSACIAEACVDVTCTADADCADVPGRNHCDPNGVCMACVEDEHCDAGLLCVDGACEEPFRCEGDDDCVGNPAGELCRESTGACVFCTGDGDCEAGSACADAMVCEVVVPDCEPTIPTMKCEPIACDEQEDCPVGSRCDGTSCVPVPACADDGDCAFDPRAPVCRDDGACVECVGDGDCSTGEKCVANECTLPQECVQDQECKAGFVCASGLCAACRTDDECPRGTCAAGACVDAPACEDDLDCASGVCAAGACAACASDVDCRPGLWCEAGACAERATCAADPECGAGRVCQGGACVDAGCADDGSEPDDAAVEATAVALGMPIVRTLCPNDEDWLVFSAQEGAGVRASLVNAPAGAQVDLAWFEPDARALRIVEGSLEEVVARALPAAAQGRYYLRVRAPGGASGAYTLIGQLQAAGTCEDSFEPNDSRSAAVPLANPSWIEGLSACGEDDYFRVPVPAGGELRAYVFTSAPSVQVGLYTLTGSSIGTRGDVPWLGGGKMAVGASPNPGEDIVVRVSVSGPAPKPKSDYALYVTSGGDAACGAAPVLLASGDDRARIVDTTIGRSADETAGVCGAGGPDAVYALTLDAQSRLLIAGRGEHPLRLSLRENACADELACTSALAEGMGVLDMPRLPAGDYELVVGGAPDAAGHFDVAARVLPTAAAPANDLCAGATDLGADADAQAQGTTLGATAEGDLSCAPIAPDVFYTFTIGSARRVVVDVRADAPVVVGLGEQPGCTSDVACDAAARTHRIDRTLAAGTYAIGVGSGSGAAVDFDLALTLPPDVPNDACADATPIAAPADVTGDTTWASADLDVGLACTGYFTGGHEVFYAVALGAAEGFTATATPDAAYDVALYVVDDCAAPACLAGVDAGFDGAAESLAFTATTAGTYYLVVDGSVGGGGFELGLR